MHHTTHKNRKRINILLAFFGFLILLAVSIPTQFATASHTTGRFSTQFAKNPCVKPLPSRGTSSGTGRSGSGFGGIFVPVKDREAISYLQVIAGNTDAIVDNIEFIEEDAQFIRRYLFLLCEKEFEEDHTIQQRWMGIVSQFVGRAMKFITTAYNDNPIFVTNPHVYFRNVDAGVLEAMYADVLEVIDDGRMNPEIGRRILITLELAHVELYFPDYVLDWTSGDASEQAQTDRAVFVDKEQFSWRALLRSVNDPQNNPYDLEQIVQQELAARRSVVSAVETEKLAWGRGFFPWELCGQQVFSKDPRDLRTCVTVTPGSVIQDMTVLTLGSALRQMENADEYEEWISARALWAANSVFTTYGLLAESYAVGTLEGRTGTQDAIGPAHAEVSIDVDGLQQGFLDAAKGAGLIPNIEKGLIFFSDVQLKPKISPLPTALEPLPSI